MIITCAAYSKFKWFIRKKVVLKLEFQFAFENLDKHHKNNLRCFSFYCRLPCDLSECCLLTLTVRQREGKDWMSKGLKGERCISRAGWELRARKSYNQTKAVERSCYQTPFRFPSALCVCLSLPLNTSDEHRWRLYWFNKKETEKKRIGWKWYKKRNLDWLRREHGQK